MVPSNFKEDPRSGGVWKEEEEEEEEEEDPMDLDSLQRELDASAQQAARDKEPIPPPSPWVLDSSTDDCMLCHSPFSIFKRKHHCRVCGKIFCDSCSDFRIELPTSLYGSQDGLQRVCFLCYAAFTPFTASELGSCLFHFPFFFCSTQKITFFKTHFGT